MANTGSYKMIWYADLDMSIIAGSLVLLIRERTLTHRSTDVVDRENTDSSPGAGNITATSH